MTKVEEAIDKINARVDAKLGIEPGSFVGAGAIIGEHRELFVGLAITPEEAEELGDAAFVNFIQVCAAGLPVEMAFKGLIEHALIAGCMIGMEND